MYVFIGPVWPGLARSGPVWPGLARSGPVWPGLARCPRGRADRTSVCAPRSLL